MPVLGAVMGTNTLVLQKKLDDWRKVEVDFKIVGELKALMYRAARASFRSKVRVREASISDLAAMFELWKKEQSRKNMGRFYPDLKGFQQAYETTPGVSLSDTFLAEADGRLIGFLSVWDQSSIRRIRIHQLNRWVKLFKPLLSPWLRIPSEGEELKIGYAFQMIVDSASANVSDGFRALAAAARTRSHQKGQMFFSVGLDARDPLLATAKKGVLAENSVKIIAANSQPEDRLFHLEVGLG
jgi:hypothetical protein